MRPTRCRAFTLIEVLVWVSLLAVLMSLTGWFLTSALDSTRRLRGALETAETRISVLERIGADVRSLSHIARASDASRLVVERVGYSDHTRVIYRFEEGVLFRELPGESPPRVVPVGRLDALAFAYDGSDPSASRWVEVELPGESGCSLKTRFYLMPTEIRP